MTGRRDHAEAATTNALTTADMPLAAGCRRRSYWEIWWRRAPSGPMVVSNPGLPGVRAQWRLIGRRLHAVRLTAQARREKGVMIDGAPVTARRTLPFGINGNRIAGTGDPVENTTTKMAPFEKLEVPDRETGTTGFAVFDETGRPFGTQHRLVRNRRCRAGQDGRTTAQLHHRAHAARSEAVRRRTGQEHQGICLQDCRTLEGI